MRKLLSLLSIILISSILSSSCSIIGIGDETKKNITVKVLAYNATYFTDYKLLLEKKFPHITFEVSSVNTILDNEGVKDKKSEERIPEIIEEQKADLYFDMSVAFQYKSDHPLVDLAPLIERDQVPLNEIQQNMIDSTTKQDGTLFKVSPTFDRRVLFVNRNLFTKYEFTEPTSPMTWEQFRMTAQQFQDTQSTLYGYDYPSYSWYERYTSWGKSIQGLQLISDTGHLLLDQPEWRNLAQQLLDDYRNKIFKADDFNIDLKKREDTGMFLGLASEIHTYHANQQSPDTLAIMDLPNNPSSPAANPYILNAELSIDASSKHVDVSWNIITYLLSKEAASEIKNNIWDSGFVTYPDLESIGEFKMESFAGKDTGKRIKESYKLSGDAFRLIFEAVEREFKHYIQEKKSLPINWGAIETVVQQINANSSYFEPINNFDFMK